MVVRPKQNSQKEEESEENKVGKKSILNNKEIAKLTKIPPLSAVASPENKEETEKGRREERKGDGFSEVKERSEVDGFAVAVAVGPWVAGERAGTEEEGGRREWRGKGKGGVGFGE